MLTILAGSIPNSNAGASSRLLRTKLLQTTNFLNSLLNKRREFLSYLISFIDIGNQLKVFGAWWIVGFLNNDNLDLTEGTSFVLRLKSCTRVNYKKVFRTTIF